MVHYRSANDWKAVQGIRPWRVQSICDFLPDQTQRIQFGRALFRLAERFDGRFNIGHFYIL